MNPTEPTAKPASTSKTGLFATLRALLHAQGSGAPSRTHLHGSGAPAGGRARLAFAGAALVSLIAILAILLTSVAPAGASEGCPNEARREEQGAAGRALPDCRAYELVSPPYMPSPDYGRYFEGVAPLENTGFEPGEEMPQKLPEVQGSVSIAVNGNAALFSSREPNSQADGDSSNLSRRKPNGWVGENIEPPQSRHGFLCLVAGYSGFSQNLDQIVFKDGYSEDEAGDLPRDVEDCGHDEPRLALGESEESANLFLRDTATSSFQLLNVTPPGVKSYDPWFAAISADGSHVVFQSRALLTPDAPSTELEGSGNGNTEYCANEFGDVYVSSAGTVHLLTILPDGTPVRGTLASAHPHHGGCRTLPPQSSRFTHSVSADGERILFYGGGGFKFKGPSESYIRPDSPYIHGGLYLRERPGADHSALAHGGASGAGTLTAGSATVSALLAATGTAQPVAGSDKLTSLRTRAGEFLVGQTVAGEGIPPGTTITAVGADHEGETLTLSAAVEAGNSSAVSIRATGPQPPFAVGQTVVGEGIPPGTTITAVAPGSLTLSAAASASATAVALEASSECTEPQKACTIQIDVPEGGSGSSGGGQFQWASADASKIFLTDEQKLTPDSTAQAGKSDLYEYDLEKPAGQRLTDLTANASEPADVLGVSGASEDGSYVYFVARGMLAANENSHGVKAQAGKSNLYLRHAGATTFIATIDAEHCNWTAYCLTSRVSSNGAFIAFDSIDSLTGYDNNPVRPEACKPTTLVPGSPCMETFRYAAAGGAHGELTCASCNPTGAPPASEFAWSVIEQVTRSIGVGNYSMQLSHNVSNSGEVFFDTMEKLVPADENKTWDVYGYAGGEGPSAQLHLISSGKSELPSYFDDATPNGSDVFFVTAQALVRSDTRSDYDLYDARVGGGFAEPLISQCESEGCRPAYPGVPGSSSPGSASFEGKGNVHPADTGNPHPAKCKKGFVKKKGKCVKQRKKKSKKAKKSIRRVAK